MKKFILLLALFGLTACASAPQVSEEPVSQAPAEPEEAAPMVLEDKGVAPELRTDEWINSTENLRIENLRGKVVLLNMWTFGCINCKRVLPYVIDWHNQYAEEGLVTIGNHYPEFNYERDLSNVQAAVTSLGIEYAVAIDNERLNWGAYNNRYWPTIYLIDKNGHLRYVKIGEGEYDLTERAIQTLLAESYESVSQ
jgi:thiol-disulfide isomerase/thioredoxin